MLFCMESPQQTFTNYSECRTLWLVQSLTRDAHVLASLHWLLADYRAQYKLAVTTFQVLNTQEPSYLSELIRFQTHLQSSGCNRLQQNLVKLAFADRAFCHATPASVWNSLPQSITSNISRFTSLNVCKQLNILIVPTINNMSFFSRHFRFVTIVNDFKVHHQPFTLTLTFAP